KELTELADDFTTILLDERGKEMTSIEFAKWIGTFEDHGEPICFVIGGPFGPSAEIKKEARHTIALSKMTLPHDMAKVILLEQLFRAFTILRGKSYHY
ncbi:MAG: 23S rRNA (pseudouridine(1915)-N(3))-methyltransferase RlmH, partial [Patescibacteria group bacterium]